MTSERNETLTTGTDLKYPMVDLFTGGTVMPLMFVNAVTTWYLLSLTAPWAFMQAWLKARKVSVLHNQSNCSSRRPANRLFVSGAQPTFR
jgi:hypothetical protein